MRTLPIFAVLFTLFSSVLYASCGEIHQFDDDKLSVADIAFNYSKGEPDSYIAAIGVLKNASESIAEDIVVEVKYFDADKKLVDVITQPLYGIEVPAGKDVAIRVRDIADKAKDDYRSAVARIVSANLRTPPQPRQKSSSNVWSSVLVSWVPMLLLIVVWVYFIKKAYKKDSPQVRMVELVVQQNAIFSRQLEILERLTVAIEKSAPPK